METPLRGIRLQRRTCIFASALLGTGTMFAVLVATLLQAPEPVFVALCLVGLGAMLTAAFIGQMVK